MEASAYNVADSKEKSVHLDVQEEIMINLSCDYCEGCHEKILQRLVETNMVQAPGYSVDDYCASATRLIRKACEDDSVAVHYLVGGTQTNLVMIAAALRPYQGVVGATTCHLNVHETGAIEGTGHKVITLPSPNEDGKITAAQVEELVNLHYSDEGFVHTVQPKMVYISQPTELGTLYSKAELTSLSETCRRLGLYFYVDGARLGYGLACEENDVTIADLAHLCDAFYIGGTKIGALFGEALVIANPALNEGFRYIIKNRGALLAKGRLLGIQFETLFQDGLYVEIAKNAVKLAQQMQQTIEELGFPFQVKSPTNQIFPIFPDALLEKLSEKYVYNYQCRVDETHSAIRLCTSWGTRPEFVDEFCRDLKLLAGR